MSKTAFKRLRLEEWPDKDRELWLKAQESDDLLDERGFAADWRVSTKTGVEKGYGIYLAWLEQLDFLIPDEMPIERVTKPRLKHFLQMYSPGRSEHTIAATVRHVAYMVRACHPPHGNEWLIKMAHRMANSATPLRPKPPRMATLPELLDLGKQLTDDGKILLMRGQQRGAWLVRDGLLILALIAHPLRCSNLVDMQLGNTVYVDEKGIHVHLSGHKTKNRRRIIFSYPDWFIEPFKFYLEFARPRLLLKSGGKDNGEVWIGRRGRPMPRNDITQAIGRRTMAAFGRQLTPHLFRDCVATGIATLDPKNVGITPSVLDHARLISSQKYYNQATGFEAMANYHTVLEKFRKDGDINCK